MTQTGVTLTFPDGRVFDITKETTITHSGEPNYLFSGLQQTLTFSSDVLGSRSGPESDYAGVWDGVGAGQRTISVSGIKEVGFSDNWGNAASSDEAKSLRDELAHALTTSPGSSNDPITFASGEYSSSGKFQELNVVPAPGWSVTHQVGDGGSNSWIEVNLELYEAWNINTPVDGVLRGE